MKELTGYELSRDFWDWSFENVGKVKPTHGTLYHYIIDLWNRLAQKDKFGLPTNVAKEETGITNSTSYKNALNDLEKWGFIKIVQRKINQHTSCVVALAKKGKACSKAGGKALDKAMLMQISRQPVDTVSIDKQINKETNKQINKEIYAHEFYENLNEEKIYAYEDEKFKTAWNDFEKGRKERGHAVMSETQINSTMRRLSDFNDLKYAIYLVEGSTQNGWKAIGFDYLKNKDEYKHSNKREGDTKNQDIEDYGTL